MSRLHFTYDYTNHTYTVCNADSSEAGANSASFMEFQGVLADFKDNEKTSLRKNIPFALQILKSTNTKDLPTIDSLISQMRSTNTSSITDAITQQLHNSSTEKKITCFIQLFYQTKIRGQLTTDNADQLFRILDLLIYARGMTAKQNIPATITFIGDAKLKEQLKTLVDCLPDLNITIQHKNPQDKKARTIYSLTQRLHHARDDTFETAGMTRQERWLHSYFGVPHPNPNQSSFITGLQWAAYFLGGFILSPAKAILRSVVELPLYYVETQAAHWYLNNRLDATKNKTLISAANVASNIFKALRATVRACLSPIKSYRHAAGMKADTTKEKWLRGLACTTSVIVSTAFIGALIFIVGPLLATHLLPKLGIHVALNFSASSITSGAITTTEAIYLGTAGGVTAMQTVTAATAELFEIAKPPLSVSAPNTRPSTPPPIVVPPVATTVIQPSTLSARDNNDAKYITSIKTTIERDDSGTAASGDFKPLAAKEDPELQASRINAEAALARDAASAKAAHGAGLLGSSRADKQAADQFQPIEGERRSVSQQSLG